ncbi:MAG TPA: MlaD family protein, partial [Victivallales bacterium]|nr:MlaD family protein [Victivallales bacterium]
MFVISLISLGMLKYFRESYEFFTIVESSVQGLEKGAKVKLKGVTIGQVSKIQLASDRSVHIYMSFDP